VFPNFWRHSVGLERPVSSWIASLFGAIAGVLLPILLVMGGWGVDLIVQGRDGVVPDELVVGPFSLPTRWLGAHGSVLRGAFVLILAIVAVLVLKIMAIAINGMTARNAAIDFDVQARRLLFEKSRLLAREQGLSSQSRWLEQMQEKGVIEVRDAVYRWYRSFPRDWVHIIGLLGVACAIHPWMTIAAFIALLIVRFLTQWFETSNRRERIVVTERWNKSREQLTYLSVTSPLLDTIRDTEDTVHSFDTSLSTYKQSAAGLMAPIFSHSVWLRIFFTLFAAIFLCLLTLRVLDRQSPDGLGELLALCCSAALATRAFTRWSEARAQISQSSGILQHVVEYLGQNTAVPSEVELQSPMRLERSLQLDHVTMRESDGSKLLEDVSLVLQPKQLIAVISTDPVQAKAITELILGFGKPSSGRIMLDGVDAIDIARDAFRKLSLWISPTGPLISDTIENNLWVGGQPDATVDLMEVARKANVAESLLNLPDNLRTLVSPTDDRLSSETMFRLGIARGFVKRPSVVVAHEPTGTVGPSIANETTTALLQLKNEGACVVVLPTRLATLRSADQIVVLHNHRIEFVGTHSQLLEQSELYRHLIYIRFAPFAN
jgi:ATP-binding cassette subfamily B protein